MATLLQGFHTRLASRSFVVFDFRALWRSNLSVRVPVSEKLKWSVSQPGHRIL